MDKEVEYTKEGILRDGNFAGRTQKKIGDLEEVFNPHYGFVISDPMTWNKTVVDIRKSLAIYYEALGLLKDGSSGKEGTKEKGIFVAKRLEEFAAQLAKEFGDNEHVKKTLAASRDIKKDIKDTYGEKSFKKDTLSL